MRKTIRKSWFLRMLLSLYRTILSSKLGVKKNEHFFFVSPPKKKSLTMYTVIAIFTKNSSAHFSREKSQPEKNINKNLNKNINSQILASTAITREALNNIESYMEVWRQRSCIRETVRHLSRCTRGRWPGYHTSFILFFFSVFITIFFFSYYYFFYFCFQVLTRSGSSAFDGLRMRFPTETIFTSGCQGLVRNFFFSSNVSAAALLFRKENRIKACFINYSRQGEIIRAENDWVPFPVFFYENESLDMEVFTRVS